GCNNPAVGYLPQALLAFWFLHSFRFSSTVWVDWGAHTTSESVHCPTKFSTHGLFRRRDVVFQNFPIQALNAPQSSYDSRELIIKIRVGRVDFLCVVRLRCFQLNLFRRLSFPSAFQILVKERSVWAMKVVRCVVPKMQAL
ncbi:MAG TPA: hypothetical protein PKI24_22190, partial [Nitrospira sp.]|nr:hypothetical protein [Nitrospira sp.]HNP42299.1 hypothetical protein [Nitrospira sp.]